MGKLYKNMQKTPIDKVKKKLLGGQSNYDAVHFIGRSAEKSYDATKDAENAATAAANEPAIPMADEEELARIRRRRARRGARETNTLTDETFGP
jgi:hypothetical protein